MARPKKDKIECVCKKCNSKFFVVPSKIREFCSKKCAQQWKGIDKNWLEKRKETCLEKYGEEIAFKSKEVQDKYKNTLIQKYGINNPFLIDEVKKKTQKTNMKKYGVKIASQNKNISNKISKKLKGRQLDRSSFCDIKWEKIINYCEYTNMVPLFDKEYLENNKLNHLYQNKFKFKCNKCDETTEILLSNGYLPTCKCSNYKGYSLIEEEINLFLLEHLPSEEINLNRRDILPNRLEIDIYLPNYNIAIEINGVYWHSESMGKYRDYHLYKTEQCLLKGIELIHILDFEWLNKKEIIKSIILNRLKLTPTQIYARKCIIKEIDDVKVLKDFLNQNHIQGYTHASINLGLYYNDKLVSVMTFGKNRFKKNSNEFELIRFCNKLNTNVVGGASKLFKYFINNKNPNHLEIISFSDRRFFNSNLYETLGFEFFKNIPPSYIYYKNNIILNRMSCQKHKLHKFLENFDPQKTEYQNMLDNKWRRIWDCGNRKFIYK